MGALIVFIVFGGPFILWFGLALADALEIGLLGGVFGVFLIPIVIILVIVFTYSFFDKDEKIIPSNLFREHKIIKTLEENNYYTEQMYNSDSYGKSVHELGNLSFLMSKSGRNSYIYDMKSKYYRKYTYNTEKVIGVCLYKNGVITKSQKTKNVDNVKLKPRMGKIDNALCFCMKDGIQYLYVIPFEESEYENALAIYDIMKMDVKNPKQLQ